MSDERYPRALDRALELEKADEVLAIVDRDLREIMSVEPSPDFTGRVRTAIRADRMEGRSGAWWLLAAAAVLALVAGSVVIGTMSRGTMSRRDAGTPSAPPPTVVAEKPPRPPVAPAFTLPVERPVVRSATREVRGPQPAALSYSAAAASRPSEPEVLVDPRQREAIGRLIALARGLPESGEPGPRIGAVLEELLVPTVIVEPLEVPALPAGGGVPEISTGRR